MAEDGAADVSRREERWWRSSVLKMYIIHGFSSSSTRTWNFGVGVYIVILHPNSLTLAAIYGFFSGISTIIVGPSIGKWIDKTKRLRAAKISFLVQHGSMIVCMGLFVVLVRFKETTSAIWDGALQYFLISLIGLVANLASDASRIALQKDWIVVLSKGEPSTLARMNATLGTIDLSGFVVIPPLIGALVSYSSHDIGAACIVAWNLISVVIEFPCLNAIYKARPELAIKPQLDTGIEPPTSTIDKDGEGADHSQRPAHCCINLLSKLRTWFEETRLGWIAYFKFPGRNAGLGYAALEMTVLGFDSITTGILMSQGVSESMLGVITSIGAGFGIVGNLVFPFVRRHLGLLVAGNIGFGAETLCLLICVASMFVTPGAPFNYEQLKDNVIVSSCLGNATRELDEDGNYSATITEIWNCNKAAILLLVGIVSSRFGLWMADLSVIQIYQGVSERERGVVSGVQGALDQSVYLLKYLIVLILPSPATFAYLIALSWLFIFTGWIFFMTHTWKNRKSANGNQDSKLCKDSTETHKES